MTLLTRTKENPAPAYEQTGTGLGFATGQLRGKGDLLRFYDLGTVSRDCVEQRLSGHRALRQFGKVATFQMLGHSIVESPESATLEFLMARITELLHCFVNRTSRKRRISTHQPQKMDILIAI